LHTTGMFWKPVCAETASASSLDAGPEITFNVNASLHLEMQV
jgi:hypothetical protein